jgi:hypothetical protein
MAIALSLFGCLLAAAVNLTALQVGYNGSTHLHHAACAFGGIGLLLMLAFFIAAIDGLSQVWVKRPGYEGEPVVYTFWLVIACTLASLVCYASLSLRKP